MTELDGLDSYRYALFYDLRKAEERAAREGWIDARDLEKELQCEEDEKTD